MGIPKKPDAEAYKKQLEQIDQKVAKLRKDLDKVKEKIDASQGGSKDELESERKKVRERMQEIRTKQNEIKAERQELLDQLRALNASMKKKTDELKSSRDKAPYKKVVDVDNQIKKLEKMVESGQLTILEEKRTLSEMSSLKKIRAVVQSFQAQQDAVEADRHRADELRKNIDDAQSKALNTEYVECQKKLDTMHNNTTAKKNQIDKLYDEKRRLTQAVQTEYTKKNELYQKQREANDAYFKHMQAERAKRAEQERLRLEKEKAELRAQRAQEERELAEIPAYEQEVAVCDSLLAYLRQTQPSSSDKSSPQPTSEPSEDHPATTPDGQPEGVVLKSKADRGEDCYFVGKASKSKKKSAKVKNAQTAATATTRLPLGILESFWQLKITVPAGASDVARAIEDIENKKKWFLQHQAEVTAENKAKAEAKIAALLKSMEEADKAEHAVKPANNIV